MAKKKTPKKKPPVAEEIKAPVVATVTDTAELLADGRNPRKISEEGAEGLAASLDRFGDLAGITFNVRTGELVTGHQRVEQIRAKYGDLPIEVLDAAAGLGVIRIDDTHAFAVRVVDWTPAKQRAANVAANNAKIQGKFTGDLASYLLEVEAELSEELPGVLDDCLLVELMAAGMDTSDAQVEGKQTTTEVGITESHQVIVQCRDEEHARQVYDRLVAEGEACKVLTL